MLIANHSDRCCRSHSGQHITWRPRRYSMGDVQRDSVACFTRYLILPLALQLAVHLAVHMAGHMAGHLAIHLTACPRTRQKAHVKIHRKHYHQCHLNPCSYNNLDVGTDQSLSRFPLPMKAIVFTWQRISSARGTTLKVIPQHVFLVFLFLLGNTASPVFAQSDCPPSPALTGCVETTDIGSTVNSSGPPLLIQGSIDPISGSAYHYAVDYQHRQSPLMLARHYVAKPDSVLVEPTEPSTAAATVIQHGAWGSGWRSTFDINLRRLSRTDLTLTQSNGTTIDFRKENTHDGKSRYLAARHNQGYVSHTSPEYRWHRPDGSTIVFRGPIPIRFEFSDNGFLQLHYRHQRLHSVTDHHGDQLTLHYQKWQPEQQPEQQPEHQSKQHIAKVSHLELPDGTIREYQYDGDYLVSTWQSDNRITRYDYTAAHTPRRLTSVQQPGATLTILYDDAARAVKVTDQLTGDTSDLIYSPLTEHVGTTTIVTSDGQSATLGWDTANAQDRGHLTAVSVVPCEHCVALSLPGQTATTNDSLFLRAHPIPIKLETGLLGVVNTVKHGINTLHLGKNGSGSERERYMEQHRNLLSPMQAMVSLRNNSGKVCPVVLPNLPLDNEKKEDDVCPDANLTTTIPGAAVRDIQTADCESLFVRYSGITRGTNIENALAAHDDFQDALFTSRRFPVVDFVSNRIAYVSKSRDLSTASYNSHRPLLYQTLLRDAKLINDKFIEPLKTDGFVSATERGITTTILNKDVDDVVLELTIRHNTATQFQRLQLARAMRDIPLKYGIELRVVEIP